MKVTIKLWGQLRNVAKQDSLSLEVLSEVTLSQVLQQIANESIPELRSILLNDEGACRQSTLIFIDDNQVSLGDGIPVADGTVITLMSPIAGG